MLIFGVTKTLTEQLDFTRVDLPLKDVLELCLTHDAIAIPCHPGRPKSACSPIQTDWLRRSRNCRNSGNGGSRDDEDQVALRNASLHKYRGIGGSDSHIVSHIGRCSTKFTCKISSMEELVKELKVGNFEAVSFK